MQQSSMIDIVPLALLVLFFGIQQRDRRQLYYRFWFLGWICVLLSYMAWGAETSGHVLKGVMEVARYDLLLLAALLFLTSFLAQGWRLRSVVLIGLLAGVPGIVAIDLQQKHTIFKALLVAVVFAWEGYGLYAAGALLSNQHKVRRGLIVALCIAWGIAMLINIWLTGAPNLSEWALSEIFLSAAILYGRDQRRTSLAGVLGTVGFVAWASSYALAVLLRPWPEAFLLLNEFWNLPKYLVAFSMILKTFEDAHDEAAVLAEENRCMYEDFRVLFDSNPNPALIYSETTGQFLLVNQAAVQSYGYSEQEFLALRRADFELPADEDFRSIDAILPPLSDGFRACFRHRDGRKMWVAITERPIRYKEMAAQFLIARDVTKRVQADIEMMRRVNHDALTGLPNRRLLEDRMQVALARAVRDDRKAAVFSIDVDHFKRINDTYGHPMGDACLKAVAERLSAKIRKVDTLARVGGEEFMALIGGIYRVADAERIAQDLLSQFEAPLQLPECELSITVSIGLAVFPDDGYDSEMLYKRSDEALYAAKQAGRNRFVYAGNLHTERESPATPSLVSGPVFMQEPPGN